MKTFLLFLSVFAFMQSAFLPLNLVLVLLIARSLVREDRSNLFMGFFGGLILSFLTQVNLGYWPIVFILVVKLSSLIKRLPVSFNPLIIFFCSIFIVSSVRIFNVFFMNEELKITTLIFEAILVVPVFYLVRGWEERFVVKGVIKLRV